MAKKVVKKKASEQVKEKDKEKSKEKNQVFVWTDDEVRLLLEVTKEYKTAKRIGKHRLGKRQNKIR